MVRGTVEKFDLPRGFGFIKPDNGGPSVFVHWEAITTDDRWPKLSRYVTLSLSNFVAWPKPGDKVAFTTETDENGTVRAKNVTQPDGKKISVTADDKVLPLLSPYFFCIFFLVSVVVPIFFLSTG